MEHFLIYQVAPDKKEPVGSLIANRTPEQQGRILLRTVRGPKDRCRGTRGRWSAA